MQMHVVGHEAIRVQVTLMLRCQLSQLREVREVVTVLPETGVPVVAALDDVERYACKDEPREPGHTPKTALPGAALTAELRT